VRENRDVVRGGIVAIAGLVGFAMLGLSTPTSATGVWNQATPAVFDSGVPDTTSTAIGRFASVSCASAGNCTAVGKFKNAGGGQEAFTMTSTGGVWGQATPAVFATGVQKAVPDAEFLSVSCASAGNCTAVGRFRNASNYREAFTMTSTGGVWGQASPAVFAGGVQFSAPNDYLQRVSCSSAGNCTAVGYFKNAASGTDAFTMTSTGGVWGQAAPAVFANGVQNSTPNGNLYSVSCASAGNCTAVGYFNNAAGNKEAFTMTSTGGVWGQAAPAVFANGVQNSVPNDYLNWVSCASAGDCTAAGRYKDVNGNTQAFTMTSTGGTWGQVTPIVFANGVQSASPAAYMNSVTCVSAGNCVAVGTFKSSSTYFEAFILTSVGGVWGDATPVTFPSGVRNAAMSDSLDSVSCATAGNCTAVGYFKNAAGGTEAFTMTATNGVWGQPTPAVFASGVQNASQDDYFTWVSCASAGNCAAVGYFMNAIGGSEAFTMTQVDNTPASTTTEASTTTTEASTTTTEASTTTAVATTTVVATVTEVNPTATTVMQAPVLPATGSDSNGWLVAAMGVVIAGTMLITRRRRTI
jgi:LPXTG-motif cell wall-anchored protein